MEVVHASVSKMLFFTDNELNVNILAFYSKRIDQLEVILHQSQKIKKLKKS